ncbi:MULTISPECIES: tetratricopeptide repeat protein [Burkholderiaceae]|uniref:tetratricopeptide repeat protein n=1 Tax=Burkholderiaceae TaxID=119060 RepID=UPI0016155539|nr:MULTISPECIES: sel1 repeat family protein [Burkholderiaceae]MBB2981391.1 hypothetical protein [Paraburkholderia tropica]
MSKFQEQIAEAIQSQDCYFLGDALPPDWYAGFKQWLPLAEAGEVKAMFNVGYCLTYGQGVDKSTSAGQDWYRKAAGLGDPRAQLALYLQLWKRKPDEAEAFLQQAVAQGDERAISTLTKHQEEANKQARAAQAAERDRLATQKATTAFYEIKSLLDQKDLAGARQRAEVAVQDGFTWAGEILAAMSLKIDMERRSQKGYIPGPTIIRDGNSVHSGTSYREYSLTGTVSNPTRYGVHVNIDLLTLSYKLLPANGSTTAGTAWMRSISNFGTKVDVMILDKVVKSLAKNGVVTVPLEPSQVSVRGGDPLSWKAVAWGLGILVVLVGYAMLH